MSTSPRRTSRSTRTAFLALASSAALATAAFSAPAATGDTPDGSSNSEALRAAVTTEGVFEHLNALQAIADRNDGTRASGTPGYAASKDYVVSKLRAAGYKPTVQAFDFPFYRQLEPATFDVSAPSAASYVDGEDFALMTYSGSGSVTDGTVQPVDLNLGGTSTSGCETSDFNGFTSGNIALVRRGTCAFAVKVVNAQDAGASAVIVMNTNPGNPAFGGTLGSPVGTVPSLGTSYAIGESLAQGGTATIKARTESEIRETWNIHADSKTGDRETMVQTGAHLDSVVVGPGSNDNGSGSAALLEVAEQMATTKLTNRVRFSWWGAEELGLLGSEHYIDDLATNNPNLLEKIAIYLNFDMVGSPNYGLFVYDGDNSAFPVGPGAAKGPEGSAQIEKLFHDYFDSQGLNSAETAFSGRSDYGPFIAMDIPAGGLFTGAEGIKTESQAELFGGQAGVAYDECYHAECDDVTNNNPDAINFNSDAMAHAVLTYGQDLSSLSQPTTSTVRGDGTPSGGGLHEDHDHEQPSS
ncbi:M28 family peptidase [Nocardioides piscis]|uniref:M20/M25/M40 family metallo-hydrolase n=1 Tax=Nocardioides piscis TaxID=2714938 RepID=A0A6G7YEF5_9ACTN|nr:M28 family peptidase [Nocardioides piscis]QIK75173.1 M20/M25/M40 family metallo-hydrolase [Nocardioides piscis]